MTEEAKDTKVSPDEAVSDALEETQVDETMASPKSDDVNKRLLNESKNWKAKARNLEQELEKMQQRQMQAEGRKDELIESLRKQVEKLNNDKMQVATTVAKNNAMNVIKSKAKELGCVLSESSLSKLVQADIADLEYDDELNPDVSQVQAILEGYKKADPSLFSRAAPKTTTHNIASTSAAPVQKKSLKEMNKEELLKAFGSALQTKK